MDLRILPLALLALVPSLASAHPHVWVDSTSELVFEKGQLTGIRHRWKFDEAYSDFASQGFDTNKDGKLSREELQPLAKINVTSLNDFDFFTQVTKGDYDAGFSAPQDYWLEQDGNQLVLHFTLPLARPVAAKGKMTVEIYDPDYFVDFELAEKDPVVLDNAPTSCKVAVSAGKGPAPGAAAILALIGAQQRALPADMKSLTTGIENTATVTCP